jgi:polyphosphate kinase 2 (PPK2 family)
MFETAELGRHISKKAFNKAEPVLQTQLLEAQRAIRAANIPVIILVSGVEGAGKGEVVNLLNTWLDARGVHTHAFWDSSDEERERPRYWRFWRALPPCGAIGILFGSWYTEPIVEHAFKRSDDTQFEHALRRIAEFEQLLVDDGAILIKFWFHLSKELQQERLKLDVGERIASPQLAVYAKHYDAFREVSERAIRQTDCGHAPWHVIEASDHRYQHLAVGRILLETLQRHLAARASVRPAAEPEPAALPEEAPSDAPRELLATLDPAAARTVLSTVDLTRTLDDKDYEKEFAALQLRLKQLTWQARARRSRVWSAESMRACAG